MKAGTHGHPAARPVLFGVQFLRFVAALSVVVYHANLAARKFIPGASYPALDSALDLGAAGVHIFFVISGFIMVHTASGKSGWSEAVAFWLRRATRIYPIYWIAALAYLAVHALFFEGYGLTAASAILAMLLIPGWESAIIGPAWTLSYEVFFYLCFGASLWFRPGLSLWVLTALFIVLVAVNMRWPLPVSVIGNPLLFEFLAGAWIARLLPGVTWRPRLLSIALLAFGLLGFAASLLLDLDAVPRTVLWGPPSALVVAGVALLDGSAGPEPVFARIGVLGDASYALYLVHVLVLDLVMALIAWSGSGLEIRGLALLIGAFVSVCVSIAMHLTIEKPMLGALRRRVKTTKAILPA